MNKEEYNSLKLAENLLKVYDGKYTRNDLLELLINAKIDSSLQSKEQKENLKMKVSQLKDLAERNNKN